MAWLSGWTHRKEIRYGTTLPASTLTNFPVLIKIAADSDIAAELGSGGGIAITDVDGDTEIPFGLYPSSDPTSGDLIIRFLASPSSSAVEDDVIAYLYYDAGQTTTEDKSGVVANNYVLFMPLEEDPSGSAPQMYDWVSESNVGTSAGSMTSGDLVAAQVGKGLDFVGDDYISTTYSGALGDFTAEAIFLARNGDSACFRRILDKDYATGFYIGHNGGGSSDSWGGGVMDTTSPYGRFITLSLNEWHTITSRRQGTTHYIIGDGGAVSTSGAVSSDSLSTATVYIANSTSSGSVNASPNDFLDGIVDEVRLSSVARSDEWVEFAHENDFNNSATFTLGSEEVLIDSGPAGVVIWPDGNGMKWPDGEWVYWPGNTINSNAAFSIIGLGW